MNPNINLQSVKQITVTSDAHELGALLDEGWLIIAVCSRPLWDNPVFCLGLNHPAENTPRQRVYLKRTLSIRVRRSWRELTGAATRSEDKRSPHQGLPSSSLPQCPDNSH